MAATELAPAPPAGSVIARAPRDRTASWPLIDRVGYWLCWAVGIGLCLVALAIVAFMAVKGLSYLSLGQLVHSPAPSVVQSQSGGFLDPIEGTLIVAALGTSIAAPLGVAIAVWLSEYRRPSWLARTVESAIEIVAGAPSVVLALFGLLIFAQSFLGFLSQRAATGVVNGRSFFAAGAVMALLALPLIVASTREGLAQLPDRLREASYALGRTRATTIRRILLSAVRPDIATGTALGMGRIIGDTAIIKILLGAGLTLQPVGQTPVAGLLRGTGPTLTTYIYENSPAGEGLAPQKAYAAAFVLLLIVLGLNGIVTWLTSRGGQSGGGGLNRAFRLIPFMPNPSG
ncbi:MAG TPA: ABC transporter permease subunit [Solirubrobacteraceae bacterium]|jgi:phosphate transport system permease protein|nr:ABC transporter permease subunit [Solirubrobacteraceae bacterium]